MGLGAGESQGLWHSPWDAWGRLTPPGVFGGPVVETQQRQCYSAFQKPFVSVACSTPIPAAQAAVDTQTDT